MDKKKNFFCQVCNKAFRDNYKLKRHEKVHIKSGELVNPSEDSSYLEDEKPIHSGTFDLNSFHFVMNIIDGHMVKPNVKLQLNKYGTAPNFIKLTQNLTSDCLLI